MAKSNKAVRTRLARALTASEQEFTPPSFGIAFAQKSALSKQTDVASDTAQALKQSSAMKLQQSQPPPVPIPQAHGPAKLASSEPPASVSRFNIDIQSLPRSGRAQSMLKQTRPGSVFIPRRSPVDYSLTDWTPNKPAAATLVTGAKAPTVTPGQKSSIATSRVRFASPTKQDIQVNPPSLEAQPAQSQLSQLFQPIASVSSQNGVSRQSRDKTPVGIMAEQQTIPPVASIPILQQPLIVQPPASSQPNQPAFAVIAQDSSALQALLSGDFGGRTFIIQPLQQSFILPQFQTAPPQLPAFTVSQPLMQPQIYSQQEEQPIASTPQPPALIQQPPHYQSSQNPVLEASRQLPTEATPPAAASREATPQAMIEPLTIAMDTRSLPQTAPCTRSPPRSVQSIFKQPSPQLYQTHEAHKISLREPQKLTAPAFLQPTEKTQLSAQRQVGMTPSRKSTPNPPQSNLLCEYAEKLKHAPRKAADRRTLAGGFIKSRSMPETESHRVISMAVGDSSVMSVIDRARLWQQERRLEEIGRSKSGFVDQDLIAHGDELVPVEERVRAFNSGQVIEENEAAKKKLNEEFEEERNRRIQEQSFLTAVKPQTATRWMNKPQNLQTQSLGPLSSQVAQGDALTKMTVKEKSNLFARRSGGARPVKVATPRRKTQPVTLDDIARVNQCILQGSSIPPASPMESFKGEDLEIGSCLSSPSASVLSDFSEIASAQSPSKHRGLRIF